MHGAIPLLHDYLESAARRLPDKVALVHEERRLTYADIDARANALANALVRQGVERGDRVLVCLDNGVEAAISFWAALKANAVVSMVSPLTKPDRLAHLLHDCRAAALVTAAQLAPALPGAALGSAHLHTVIVTGEPCVLERPSPRAVLRWEEALASSDPGAPPPRRSLDVDLASLVYTSGSTGEPKGVMLTHRNMLTAATSITSYLRNTEDDVVLGALPLSFDYGLYQMIMAFRMGARLVLTRPFVYLPCVLRTVEEEGVTGFPGVPTMFAMMAEMKTLKDHDFSKIRYATSTAATLPEKHIDFLRDLFPEARIYSMYGLTECKRCTYLPPEDIDRKKSSVGVAIPNTELWIIDEEGQKLGPGKVGQLVVRGATVMKGYWEKPEETAKKLHPGPVPGEQVLHTGDLGWLDEEGYLHFVGRMDDVFKSRGEKVAPKEVERALTNVPGVLEAAVVGVPDALQGRAIKAFVVLESGSPLTERDLVRECQRRLESFLVPKIVAIVAGLPRTPTGKIDKTALR